MTKTTTATTTTPMSDGERQQQQAKRRVQFAPHAKMVLLSNRYDGFWIRDAWYQAGDYRRFREERLAAIDALKNPPKKTTNKNTTTNRRLPFKTNKKGGGSVVNNKVNLLMNRRSFSRQGSGSVGSNSTNTTFSGSSAGSSGYLFDEDEDEEDEELECTLGLESMLYFSPGLRQLSYEVYTRRVLTMTNKHRAIKVSSQKKPSTEAETSSTKRSTHVFVDVLNDDDDRLGHRIRRLSIPAAHHAVMRATAQSTTMPGSLNTVLEGNDDDEDDIPVVLLCDIGDNNEGFYAASSKREKNEDKKVDNNSNNDMPPVSVSLPLSLSESTSLAVSSSTSRQSASLSKKYLKYSKVGDQSHYEHGVADKRSGGGLFSSLQWW